VVICRQVGTVDPIAALVGHLAVNKLAGSDPMFAYRSENRLRTLTKSKFLARCNAIWHDGGFPRIVGHCFRIGGTTALLVHGVPPDVVRTMGRWSSDSFLLYIRDLDVVAPLHVELLTPLLSSV
jgi:hypothetical protein